MLTLRFQPHIYIGYCHHRRSCRFQCAPSQSTSNSARTAAVSIETRAHHLVYIPLAHLRSDTYQLPASTAHTHTLILRPATVKMWALYIFIFLLGNVFGPWILPGYVTPQIPAPNVAFYFPEDYETCFSPIVISGPIFTDRQFFLWGVILSVTTIVSLALGTFQVLLRTRPQYVDAAANFAARLVKTWAPFLMKVAPLVIKSIWASFKNAAIVSGKYVKNKMPECQAFFMKLFHDTFTESPDQLEKMVAEQAGEIASLKLESAAHQQRATFFENAYSDTTSALNSRTQDCHLARANEATLKKENADLEIEIKALKHDKDLHLMQQERAEQKRQVDGLNKTVKVEQSARAMAEKRLDQQREWKDKAEEDLRTRTQELGNALRERDELKAQAQGINVALRDAREYDIVRKAIHVCAETRGDTMPTAIIFATVLEGLGGSLQALGIDYARYQGLKEWVINGQNPHATVQPCGFS